MIIDTHTHFYDPARPEGVPWPPKDNKLLYRTVLPPEYKDVAIPEGIHPTVGMPGVKSCYFWVMNAHRRESRRYDLAKDDPGFVWLK